MTAAVVDLAGLDWRVHARCRGADLGDFFPHLQGCGARGGPDLREATATAWKWCQPCPVIDRCHALAERNPRTVGIWGGCLRWQRGGRITGPVEWVPLVPAAPVREAS